MPGLIVFLHGLTGDRRLMVDSGGFALMTNPDACWALRDVSKFIAELNAEIFVSLDYPPAKMDSKKSRQRKITKSARNVKILTERFPAKIIMPVVHGRTAFEIDLSIQLIGKAVPNPTWIGLGGIVPLLQHRFISNEIARQSPEVFIALALAKIRNAFPNAKIHAFGAGGTQTFPAVFAFGADSADSIGWRQAAGFGSIFLPLRSQRAIRWNLDKRPPRRLLDESDLAQLELCACPICTMKPLMASRLADFRSSFHSRSIHNAWAVTHQMKYWPSGRLGIRQLVSKGGLGPAWAKALDLV